MIILNRGLRSYILSAKKSSLSLGPGPTDVEGGFKRDTLIVIIPIRNLIDLLMSIRGLCFSNSIETSRPPQGEEVTEGLSLLIYKLDRDVKKEDYERESRLSLLRPGLGKADVLAAVAGY